MKILFLSSANRSASNPIIVSQGKSLEKKGLHIEYYGITGKGVAGYLSNLKKIRALVQSISPDIIHAHFSFSGMAASLARTGVPVVVSLMGSDTRKSPALLWITRRFSRNRWSKTIIKSESMRAGLKNPEAVVIPNGVDLDLFSEHKNKLDLKMKYSLSVDKKTVLFLADPSRASKNFRLAHDAMAYVDPEKVELTVRTDIPHENVAELINAADMVLLTSRWEGSPNVVKEAMACNCPVVATSVGDVAWLFGNETGYYTADFNPQNIGNRISEVMQLLDDGVQINGRQRIIRLGLDSESIASRLIKVYEEVLKSDENRAK